MNFRYSKQRDAVMKVLDKINYHPTVDEIYDIVRKKYPKVSLATIYRNVEQLTQMNKIWKIELPNEPARYDGNMEKHHHVRCSKCNAINDVWIEKEVTDLIDIGSIKNRFSITSFKIEFEGICENCQESAN